MGNGICALLLDLRNAHQDDPGRQASGATSQHPQRARAGGRRPGDDGQRDAGPGRPGDRRRRGGWYNRLVVDVRRRRSPTTTAGDGERQPQRERHLHGRRLHATFERQDAYRLNITGTITGGSGSATVTDVGNANLDIIRRQRDAAPATCGAPTWRCCRRRSTSTLTPRPTSLSSAPTSPPTSTCTLTPEPGWRTTDFPLEPGRHAGTTASTSTTPAASATTPASVAPASSRSTARFAFNAPANVATRHDPRPDRQRPHRPDPRRRPTTAPSTGTGGRRRTRTTRGTTCSSRSTARTLTIDRQARAPPRRPAPATALTETITPSLTCAGGDVHGRPASSARRGRRAGPGGPGQVAGRARPADHRRTPRPSPAATTRATLQRARRERRHGARTAPAPTGASRSRQAGPRNVGDVGGDAEELHLARLHRGDRAPAGHRRHGVRAARPT